MRKRSPRLEKKIMQGMVPSKRKTSNNLDGHRPVECIINRANILQETGS